MSVQDNFPCSHNLQQCLAHTNKQKSRNALISIQYRYQYLSTLYIIYVPISEHWQQMHVQWGTKVWAPCRVYRRHRPLRDAETRQTHLRQNAILKLTNAYSFCGKVVLVHHYVLHVSLMELMFFGGHDLWKGITSGRQADCATMTSWRVDLPQRFYHTLFKKHWTFPPS